MSNELALKVNRLEKLTHRLAESSKITNEVITELATELSTEVRAQIKEEIATCTQEIENNVITTVSKTIESTVNEKLDDRGLATKDADRLTKARNKRMYELLGDSRSDRYILYIKFYQSRMRNTYYKHFNVTRYADITPAQFTEALEFIQKFDIIDDNWWTNILHETYRNDEFDKSKLRHAYERYFDIC